MWMYNVVVTRCVPLTTGEKGDVRSIKVMLYEFTEGNLTEYHCVVDHLISGSRLVTSNDEDVFPTSPLLAHDSDATIRSRTQSSG